MFVISVSYLPLTDVALIHIIATKAVTVTLLTNKSDSISFKPSVRASFDI
jgi:hypothetical protein